MYEASGTLYSSTTAQYSSHQSQQAPAQEYPTATTVIYQPPIIQPYLQPQQYYVQQQMWSASFQQAPATYYPQYTIQQPAYQTPEQAQPVPLVNLARLVNSPSQTYSSGTGGAVMNVSSASMTTAQVSSSVSRTKMVPTRLKNMGGGARTKAKMREMLEQQKQMELAKQQASASKKRVRKSKDNSSRKDKPNENEVKVVKDKPKSGTSASNENLELSQSIDDTIQSVLSASTVDATQASAQPEPNQSALKIEQVPTPKKKGRPRKYPLPDSVAAASPVRPAQPEVVGSPGKKVSPERRKAESPKKVTITEPPPATTEPTPVVVAKKPRGRPRSIDKKISAEHSEAQPLPIYTTPTAPATESAVPVVAKKPRGRPRLTDKKNPVQHLEAHGTPTVPASPTKKSSPGKSRSLDKGSQPETVSPKEKKVKLSPSAAAILKAKASEKLKTAKVRIRAKAAKELKIDEGLEIGQGVQAPLVSLVAAALKSKQREVKIPAVRIRKPKKKVTDDEVNMKKEGQGEGEQNLSRKVVKLRKPTVESIEETIKRVLEMPGNPETNELVPYKPPAAIPSTSASALLAQQLEQAQRKPIILKSDSKKGPTVLIKRSDLKVLKRLSSKERKEHRQKGPSLKVKKEKVTFYRGGEEEEPVVRVGLERPRVEFDESVPWRCIFCNFKQYCFGLGDLFGPYYVDRWVNGQVRPKETWLHSGCSVWASGVVLIGSTLYGLADAVEQSERTSCTVCKRPGATIACFERRCHEVAHLPCAVINRWSLNEKNFRSLCPAHVERDRMAGGGDTEATTSPTKPKVETV